MRGLRKIFLTILAVIALSNTLFAMGSKDSGKPKLKGVLVSKDGQVYPKGTNYLTLDVAGDNSFTFTATSDPVANGTPVKVTSANPSVAQVTQSAASPSVFTITALRQGGTYVEVKCDYYKFVFSITVNDTSEAGIARAKSEQQRKEEELREIQRQAEANTQADILRKEAEAQRQAEANAQSTCSPSTGSSGSSGSSCSPDTSTTNAATATVICTADSKGFVTVKGATIKGSVSGSEVFVSGRTITIPDLYVCDHEVTQAEYEKYCTYRGNVPNSDWGNPLNGHYGAGSNYPVFFVDWYDAVTYCNKRSAAEGYTQVYTISGDNVTANFNANGYRLPTEAEWEYLARGGFGGIPSSQTTYSGSDSISAVGWYEEPHGSRPHLVKQKAPNRLGLYDMSGNVFEWCWDYYGNINSSTSAYGPSSGSERILRGGALNLFAGGCSVSYRSHLQPYNACNSNIGFRVVRNTKGTASQSGSGTSGTTGSSGSSGGITSGSSSSVNVGDIVYSDGTISSAANYNRSKTAVAVIFDPSRKLGVGLKKPVVKTFVASNSTKGYSTNLGTSSSDGSKNFETVARLDPTGALNQATDYPAFNYANTYSDSGFSEGWYLPSLDEAKKLFDNLATVNASIAKMSGVSQITQWIWSSTQVPNNDTRTYSVRDGTTYFCEKYVGHYVVAIRSFDPAIASATISSYKNALSIARANASSSGSGSSSGSSGGSSTNLSGLTEAARKHTAEEIAVLTEQNYARTNPKEYVQTRLIPLRQSYTGDKLAALNECIAEMNAMTALSPLDWGEGLYKAADEWARTQGPTGQTGHASNTWDRVKKYCSYSTSGENISYGPNTGKEIVIQLLVDYGVADRGHRKNILSSKFTHAGAAIETHSYYRYECVIDYAGGYREK